MTYKVTFGTISSGTLSNVDLLEAFSDELARIDSALFNATADNDSVETHKHSELVDEARAVLTLHNAGWNDIADSEEASELVSALVDALTEHAPAYGFFGNTEGDGSDFGFWPSMEQIEELPRVQDSDEAKALGEDCVCVNDHGNVTLYGGDGEVIWDIV